jgi:hypothetical protein
LLAWVFITLPLLLMFNVVCDMKLIVLLVSNETVARYHRPKLRLNCKPH